MGYVTFKVKIHPDYIDSLSDEGYNEVYNQAAIYFDYNPVILTNTYLTTFINEPVVIEGDTMLCPNGEGTAHIVGSEVYDTYQWYYKYWFISGDFMAIDGANSASFTYDWYTYDQALLKVVVTKDGVTSESNTIQIDSYAWLPITTSLELNENVQFNPNTESYELCQGAGFTMSVNPPYDIATWYKDGVAIEGATETSYTMTEAGTYHVVAAPSFCPNSTSTSLPIVVTLVDCGLGTDNPNEVTLFELYPNPTRDVFYINNYSGEVTQYRIMDISGKLITHGTIPQNRHSISLQGLSQGLYFINLTNSSQQQTLKLIKK